MASQITISIFHAVNDVIYYFAGGIQCSAICFRKENVVIVVQMVIQQIEIDVCKGWICIETNFFPLVAKAE